MFLPGVFAGQEKIFIFHAGSLSIPFKQMEEAFEKKYPQYNVLREGSGSRKAARKICAQFDMTFATKHANFRTVKYLTLKHRSH